MKQTKIPIKYPMPFVAGETEKIYIYFLSFIAVEKWKIAKKHTIFIVHGTWLKSHNKECWACGLGGGALSKLNMKYDHERHIMGEARLKIYEKVNRTGELHVD